VRQVGPIYYLIALDYGDTLRIIFYNRSGEYLGNNYFDPTPKFLKKLDKSTIVKHKLPRAERKIVEDDTILFQKRFTKLFQEISHRFGIILRYPRTLLIDSKLKYQQIPSLGCKKEKDKIYIPSELQTSKNFELFVIYEWFNIFLHDKIQIIDEIDMNIFYVLSLLLTAIYRPEYIEIIKNIYQSSALNDTYKTANIVLKSIPTNPPKDTLIMLLKRYLETLQLLRQYRFYFSTIEFVELFLHTCELFDTNSDYYAYYTHYSDQITESFLFTVFSHANEIAKKSNDTRLKYKTYLLFILFGLQIRKFKIIFSNLITVIKYLLSYPLVYEQVLRIEDFVSDILSKYIALYIIQVQEKHSSDENVVEIVLQIDNTSDYIFQDFEYNLKWKPKTRLDLSSTQDLMKSFDLHNTLKRRYLFSQLTPGKITLSCTISFINPIFQDKIMKVTINIKKIG